MDKLTEDEVVLILGAYLEQGGRKIVNRCLGQKHGRDIEAYKSNNILVVEAKGARAGV